MLTSSTPTSVGYGGLLNLHAGRHHLVVISDFPIAQHVRSRLASATEGLETQLHFLQGTCEELLRQLTDAGVDLDRDYVTLHSFYCTHESTKEVRRLFHTLSNADRCTVELPPDLERASERALRQIEVIASADYAEQERLSKRFFALAEASVPYTVDVLTSGGALSISDTKPWFQLAGPIARGETRGLPGGEVAYTGSSVSGTFVVDGAILATPAVGTATDKAAAIGKLSPLVKTDPLTFHIESGRVTNITSAGDLAARLLSLLDLPDYRTVTEVGVSFNRACNAFIHDWAAPSNEGRPGVHVAVGGDPDPAAKAEPHPELVHIDFLAATTVVAVNRQIFLRTSHGD